MKKILIVAATNAEADVIKKISGIKSSGEGFFLGNAELSLLITGVGSISTSWAMARWISSNPEPDLAINIGIAGSYKKDISIGDVVVPVTDCFADAGIETGNSFLTLSEAGLDDMNRVPFREGRIHADNHFIKKAVMNLRQVDAITVNTATGSDATKERLLNKYDPDIETMEGATFFYICSVEKIPFLALRSVSNMVEPRDKNKWNIPLALERLSEKLNNFILMIE